MGQRNATPASAIVAGFGSGLGEAISRSLVGAGYRVAGLSRTVEQGTRLAAELNGETDVFKVLAADVADGAAVSGAIDEVAKVWGPPAVYVHNASQILLRSFLETKPDEFEQLWRVACLGAAHGAQAVLPAMLERGKGTLIFIGATASVKGGPRSAAFSSAKFALRGLSQSLARAYGSEGIHVAHVVIDGVIWRDGVGERYGMTEDQCLRADAVAGACLHLIQQERSAWTQELDIRPYCERF